jgi:hypothetical protein
MDPVVVGEAPVVDLVAVGEAIGKDPTVDPTAVGEVRAV